MQLPKLKTLIEVGAIQQIRVVYDASNDGWTLLITYQVQQAPKTEALERQRGGVRVFATLDAAAHCLGGLGIREFQVSAGAYGAKS